MPAVDSARAARPPPPRIHRSHSRSRQLLSLPASPLRPHKPASAWPFAAPKPRARPLALSRARLLRAAVLAAAAALILALLRAAASFPDFHPHMHYIPRPHNRRPRPNLNRSDAHADRRKLPLEQLPLHAASPFNRALSDPPRPTHTSNLNLTHQETQASRRDDLGADQVHSSSKDHPAASAISIQERHPPPPAPPLHQTPISPPSSETQTRDTLDREAQQGSQLGNRDPADFASFTLNTSLNYFHLHKTGGVSFKERLFDFFMVRGRLQRNGRPTRIIDTCHMSGAARPALGSEAKWSCDWGEIQEMAEEDRNKIDVVVGHQYWERGVGYWIPNRDVRHFTVMRHPLHRKVSFFYHFFVRNAGRSEDHVTEKELIQFILGKDMPDSELIRDAGPGYYASRLWSDGLSGYGYDNKFKIPGEEAGTMVQNSVRRLRRNFVFIGLQTQELASLCMLQKTVAAFTKAHGFKNVGGLEDISKQRERRNTGSYPLSGKMLWNRMSEDQKNEFRRIEQVDLAIYKESVKMFHEMARKFECSDLITDSKDVDDIAL